MYDENYKIVLVINFYNDANTVYLCEDNIAVFESDNELRFSAVKIPNCKILFGNNNKRTLKK